MRCVCWRWLRGGLGGNDFDLVGLQGGGGALGVAETHSIAETRLNLQRPMERSISDACDTLRAARRETATARSLSRRLCEEANANKTKSARTGANFNFAKLAARTTY